MKVSERGVKLIKGFEGYARIPYLDAAGVTTWGYGHARRGREAVPASLSKEQADALLRADLERFEQCVSAGLRVPVAQHEFDALVSLAFNIGCKAFAGSTLLRRLNGGDRAGAAAQFLRWNKATVAGERMEIDGLTNRRKRERAVFLGEK